MPPAQLRQLATITLLETSSRSSPSMRDAHAAVGVGDQRAQARPGEGHGGAQALGRLVGLLGGKAGHAGAGDVDEQPLGRLAVGAGEARHAQVDRARGAAGRHVQRAVGVLGDAEGADRSRTPSRGRRRASSASGAIARSPSKKPLATSEMVPSPPTATISSAPSRRASRVSSVACPGAAVRRDVDVEPASLGLLGDPGPAPGGARRCRTPGSRS